MSASKKRKIIDLETDESLARNPIECLAKLKVSEKMSDLTIIIQGHEENFKVHRLILSMWSNVFEAMLYGPMAEGQTITIEEDSPQAFKWLLDYMYKGEAELPSVDLAIHVYLLADKYMMEHLKTVCSEMLINEVTAETVPEILNIATLLADENLINKCFEVVDKSADSFFSSDSIGLLSTNSLKELLKTEYLTVSNESLVFKGIMTWSRHQLKSLGKETTPTNLRVEVEKFLPDIRFLTMTLEDFVRHVLPENILTFKEVQAIQLNIVGVSNETLDSLFSSNKERRCRFNVSKLQKCHIHSIDIEIMSAEIRNLRHLFDDSNNLMKVSRPIFLYNIKVSCTIYLDKLEIEKSIIQMDKITVYDSSGNEIQKVDFDGRVAKFERMKMDPQESYSFTLEGTYKLFYDAYCQKHHSVANNALISGYIVSGFEGKFLFHYWK